MDSAATPMLLQPPRIYPLSTLDELLQWKCPRMPWEGATTDDEAELRAPNPNPNPDPANAATLANHKKADAWHRAWVCYAAESTWDAPSTTAGDVDGLRPKRNASPPARRSLLVCHDMMGGYLDSDALVQGQPRSAVRNLNEPSYNMVHWQTVDQFVYFSHHLVTIPPPGWTNAAHKHGVQVLGTFITEWGDGAKLCKTMLANRDVMVQAANNLAAIAQFHGFDGWLVNIENPIAEQDIPMLVDFVTHLKIAVKRVLPSAVVMWYDSVTTDGHLSWQNALNRNNKVFFDAADSIFLNYGWTLRGLRESSSAAAGSSNSSPHDVFVGVDVFGRGCRGGGGFNVTEALEVIREHNLSAAVFAPGWVYENLDKAKLCEHQHRFWASVAAAHGEPLRPISALPFLSTFDNGHADPLAVQEPHHTHAAPYMHLSAQTVQPSFLPLVFSHGAKESPNVTKALQLAARQMGEPWGVDASEWLASVAHPDVLQSAFQSCRPFDGISGGLQICGTLHAARIERPATGTETLDVHFFLRDHSRTLRLFKTDFNMELELTVGVAIAGTLEQLDVYLQLLTDSSVQSRYLDLSRHLVLNGLEVPAGETVQLTPNSAITQPRKSAQRPGGWTLLEFELGGDTIGRVCEMRLVVTPRFSQPSASEASSSLAAVEPIHFQLGMVNVAPKAYLSQENAAFGLAPVQPGAFHSWNVSLASPLRATSDALGFDVQWQPSAWLLQRTASTPQQLAQLVHAFEVEASFFVPGQPPSSSVTLGRAYAWKFRVSNLAIPRGTTQVRVTVRGISRVLSEAGAGHLIILV
ncbi:endo-beta-N-acetylglucosaminidase [Capsaspora owczarzaki ATCC 30864]|nr:endo-beta-N-acetylglucosaminidase [Capsaspora owczarzaki ATCC 30864]|eukprot:XP_004363545.1 endo-beta-N-acetylglucosaminidase [Capsaspora owczarzaki ATCC 30864]